MINRREFLLTSLATRSSEQSRSLMRRLRLQVRCCSLCIKIPSRAAGFRASLEGWSRAGIEYVELNDFMLDGFLENDSLAFSTRSTG